MTIAARVPPELAEAVAALADAGDRTVSREVFRAIRTHVETSAVGGSSANAVGRSSVEAPQSATTGPPVVARQSSPPLLAGEER